MTKFTFLQKIRNKIRTRGKCTLCIANSAKIVHCNIFIKGKNNSLTIEEGVTLRYTHIEILGENCSIFIGKNSIIGQECYLSAKESRTLYIGRDSMLSRNVKLMTSDGHPIYKDKKIINEGCDVHIEEHVWLSDNVTVLKGVRVGKNSIVGINATLTKSIASGTIAVGNPAKVVKDDVSWCH